MKNVFYQEDLQQKEILDKFRIISRLERVWARRKNILRHLFIKYKLLERNRELDQWTRRE